MDGEREVNGKSNKKEKEIETQLYRIWKKRKGKRMKKASGRKGKRNGVKGKEFEKKERE